MKKILIIKLGYSETLDKSLSLDISLGDVLRTTFMLHFFKECKVSWLVDRKAFPLLENNKYIHKIRIYSARTIIQLKKEKFDTVINFEKLPGVYSLLDSLAAGERFGFRSNGSSNGSQSYSAGSRKLMEISQAVAKRRENKDCWQKILAQSLGKKWQGQEYILGYKPKSKTKYDIGFNWTTSNKWVNKSWPRAYWEELDNLIKDSYAVSWQQGFHNLHKYMDWINSCRLIVTADTLGFHLALALKKKVVALFGPTSPYEMYFYNRGAFLLPESSYKCIPCLKTFCSKKKKCMEYISPQRVKERIEHEFKKCISSQKL